MKGQTYHDVHVYHAYLHQMEHLCSYGKKVNHKIFTCYLYHHAISYIFVCFFDTLQSVMDVSHMNMLWLKNDWVNFVILNVCFTCFCHKQPFPSVLQDLGLSASLYHHLTAHLLNDQEIFYNYSIQIHFPLVFIFFKFLWPVFKSN